MNDRQEHIKRLEGETELPGDRFLSLRTLILGSLAQGKSVLKNFSGHAECQSAVEILRSLGVEISIQNDTCVIQGRGKQGWQPPANPIEISESRNLYGILIGVLAGQSFESQLKINFLLSDPKLVSLFEKIGARIQFSQNGEGHVLIQPSTLSGGTLELAELSNHWREAFLFAGLFGKGPLTLVEPEELFNTTENIMRFFQVNIEVRTEKQEDHQDELKRRLARLQRKNSMEKIKGQRLVVIHPSAEWQGVEATLAGDTFLAHLFMLGALLAEKSKIVLKRICLNPWRLGIFQILKRMDAQVEIISRQESAGEVCGDIQVKHSHLQGRKLSGEIMTRVLEEMPLVALAVALADGKSIIRNIEKLREGQSDRLAFYIRVLRQVGVRVGELPDGMIVEGRKEINGGEIDCKDDLVMGMLMTVLGPFIHDQIVIKNSELIEIQYPGFFQLVHNLQVKR